MRRLIEWWRRSGTIGVPSMHAQCRERRSRYFAELPEGARPHCYGLGETLHCRIFVALGDRRGYETAVG